MRQLFITCDDGGLSEGINLATVELFQKGIATDVSVMTNFAATQHALELFSLYPALGIGVHLNLTDGFCLAKTEGSSSLTHTDGRFRSRASLFARALVPSARLLERAENELTAQIEVLAQAGLEPQHLTTHIHFHTFPALRKIIFELAQRFHVSWVRAFSPRAAVLPINPFLHRKTGSPGPTGAKSVLIPDYIVGLKYWLGRHPKHLLSKLLTLQGIIELVVHPCTAQDDTYPQDIYYLPHERFKEMHYLEQFYQLLQKEAADDIVIMRKEHHPRRP